MLKKIRPSVRSYSRSLIILYSIIFKNIQRHTIELKSGRHFYCHFKSEHNSWRQKPRHRIIGKKKSTARLHNRSLNGES